jgi:hypothetical protein
MAVLLRAPGHARLDIVTIRIDVQVYPEEYAYTFDAFEKDAAVLIAVHRQVRRLDVHYNRNSYKEETMRSFFATDL